MTIQQVLYILVTGALFMALVAYVSYRMTRGKVESADDYFLAGRGLTGVFIAGSLH